MLVIAEYLVASVGVVFMVYALTLLSLTTLAAVIRHRSRSRRP